ncbi:MAG: exodeoxyribonuclease VII small subunit [Arenicella sp.]
MSKDKDNQPAASLNFEQAYDTLEQLVARMEQGNQSLEQSLNDFEHGIQLIKQCHHQLKEAEQKVEILMQDSDGNVQSQPLISDTENTI